MIENWPIRIRLLLLGVLPAGLIALALGFFFLTSLTEAYQQALIERGETMVQQLAPLAAGPVHRGHMDQLRALASTELATTDVKSISILGAEREVLAQASLVRFENSSDRKSMPPLRFEAPVRLIQGPHGGTGAQDESAHAPIGWVVAEILQTETSSRKKKAIDIGILIMISGLLLAAVAARLFSRGLSAPILNISHTVDEISHGNLEARTAALSDGELGRLARGINIMADRLADSQMDLRKRIEDATRELQETLDELEVKNIELNFARKRALAASQFKTDFLAQMSHEIRTPMNGIIGFSDLLMLSGMSREQREYVETIRGTSAHLLSIINEILEFSRYEAGNVEPVQQSFSLCECIESVTTRLMPLAQKEDLDLVIYLYSDVPDRLVGDSIAICRILTNLIGNAIKYTPKGEIVVRAMLDDDTREDQVSIRISVTDTGPGVPESVQAELFKPYVQVMGPERPPELGGTGLGLAISKQQVDLLGGDIGVESREGQGAMFWFTFSARLDPVAQPDPPTLQGCRVALCEAHQSARLALRHQLSAWEVSYTWCASLNGLREILSSDARPFDLVILGLSRQELDDRELRAELDALLSHWHLPIIVLGNAPSHVIRQTLGDRVSAVISRPPPRQSLYQAIAGLWRTDGSHLFDASDSADARIPDLTGNRILVADDDPVSRKLASTLLSRTGASVQCVNDGRAVVGAFKEHGADLVLMDLRMPELNGPNAARAIRECGQRGRLVPILALSANVPKDTDPEYEGLFDDYLAKPVGAQLLWDKLAHWLAIETTQRMQLSADDHEINEALRTELNAELPRLRAEIREAVDNEDSELLADRAHALQGAAAACRLVSLRDAARNLEESSGLRRVGEIEAELDAVLGEIDRLIGHEQR